MKKIMGPSRIFATVNGMSTRLPDGKRQFIGGWSEDKDRPHAIEYVRANLAADLVKALEHIARQWPDSFAAKTARAALTAARIGGAK